MAIVYAFRNSNHPECVKIGMTTQDVSERLEQANRYPSEFTLDGFNMQNGTFDISRYILVEDCRGAEKIIHGHLNEYRIRKNREFFECDDDILNKVLDLIAKNEKNVNYCCTCDGDGELILCDKCLRSYHLDCKYLSGVPNGEWICGDCSVPLEIKKYPSFLIKSDEKN